MREDSPGGDREARRVRLLALLRDLGGAVVAFSGGVDSAYLLASAHDALGDRCVGATAVSSSLAADELEIARRIASSLGARHILIATGEFGDPRYLRNDAQRCYFCKQALFERLAALALDLGLPYVAYGANVDDLGDYRPGMRAASEFRVRAPLLEAGLGKADVRALAQARGLDVWDKPASPCLASRLPLGTPVTPHALAQVERSERALRGFGFRDVRVRHHGDTARIEVPLPDVARLLEVVPEVSAALQALGYRHVTVARDGLHPGRGAAAAVPAADPAPGA